ncbi:hypothetical protein [Escherichia phage dw-ec]|nr:hypothetical protein [Escherichia phage BI-EHEC]UJQ43715.1 hypothetical protein [Escherichia phage dw-ec]
MIHWNIKYSVITFILFLTYGHCFCKTRHTYSERTFTSSEKNT